MLSLLLLLLFIFISIRCISGINFIRTQSEVEKRINKFLSALTNVGGPVADASAMIQEEWELAMES